LGREAVRRIAVPHLPGCPILTGQESVQDRSRNPLLAREGTRAGGDGARLLSPHVRRGDDGPFGRLASRRADIEEDPRSDCRGAGRVEEGPPKPRLSRGRLAQAASARLRPESSADPGPAAEGLRLASKLPRQPGHEPGVPRLLHRGVRVDGPAEPLPGGSDRPPLVGPGLDASPLAGASSLSEEKQFTMTQRPLCLRNRIPVRGGGGPMENGPEGGSGEEPQAPSQATAVNGTR